MYSNVYMSVPMSHFILSISHLGNYTFVSYICDSLSVLWISSFVPFLKILLISYIIWYLSFSWTHIINEDC